MPVAGPMDAYSHRLANRCSATIRWPRRSRSRCSDPSSTPTATIVCAVAGARVRRHGERRGRRSSRAVRSCRRRSRCGSARAARGARATLAVRGGFDVPPTLGSRATQLVSRMGPFGGRPLARRRRAARSAQCSRRLATSERWQRAARAAGRWRTPPRRAGRASRAVHRRRVGLLVRRAVHRHAAVESDGLSPRRTGRSLTSAPPTFSRTRRRSASLQVPASGQPILLMADRQTTGGYPTIATVITADLPIAGQLAPGDWIEFTPVYARGGHRRAARSAKRPWREDGRERPTIWTRCSPAAFRAERVQRNAPLAPFTTFKVGGPADWLVHRAARERGARRRSPRRATAGLPVTVLGGGSNVLVADAGVRGLVIRVHGGDVHAGRRRARPRRRRADHQRAGPLDDQSRRRRTRGVGRHARHGRRRDLRQRAFQGTADQRAGRRASRLVDAAGGHDVRMCRRPRWSSATTAAGCSARARSSCPPTSGSDAASRPRCAPSRASRWRIRKRTQPLESPSAGCIFQNPDPAARSRARRHPGVGRRAGRSRRPEGRARRGGARVADARQLHRQRRRRDGARHPRADRALPRARCTRNSASSCATKSSTWASGDRLWHRARLLMQWRH